MNENNLIDLCGGRSIDTIDDCDLDKTLCKIDTMQKYNCLNILYNLDKESFNFLFGTYNN